MSMTKSVYSTTQNQETRISFLIFVLFYLKLTSVYTRSSFTVVFKSVPYLNIERTNEWTRLTVILCVCFRNPFALFSFLSSLPLFLSSFCWSELGHICMRLKLCSQTHWDTVHTVHRQHLHHHICEEQADQLTRAQNPQNQQTRPAKHLRLV